MLQIIYFQVAGKYLGTDNFTKGGKVCRRLKKKFCNSWTKEKTMYKNGAKKVPRVLFFILEFTIFISNLGTFVEN